MKFIDSLSVPPRLVLDPAHLRDAIGSLRQRFPEISIAVLRPAADGFIHTLLLHTDASRDRDAADVPIVLAAERLAMLLEDQHHALLHLPFAGIESVGTLFPGAQSLFLRRAFSAAGEELLLVFAVGGVDAEFASRHGAALLADRLRHRFDDHLLQNQLAAVTRTLERQLSEVKTVKEKLLPAADHRVHGARYAVLYQPCAGGGGDYYEIADLRPARSRLGLPGTGDIWGVIIGDVSGHGPGAAVEVAMLDAILRTFEPEPGFHPGHVLSYLNRHMFTRQIRGGFITSFQAIYDGERGTLGFTSAGHPAALVKPGEAGAETRLLECGGDIPLGIEPEHEWTSDTIPFGAEDMLVLYTDGASEARSPDGREFGIEGLRRAVEDSAAREPDALLADIVAALDRHGGGTAAMDDCTIVVVQPAR